MKKTILYLTNVLKQSPYHLNNKRVMRDLESFGERKINRLDREKYFWTSIYGRPREQFISYLTDEKYQESKEDILQMHYIIVKINEILLRELSTEYKKILEPYQEKKIIFNSTSDVQYKILEKQGIPQLVEEDLNNNFVYKSLKGFMRKGYQRDRCQFAKLVNSLHARVRKYGLDSLKDYNDFSFCLKKSEFAKEVLLLIHYKDMILNLDQILYQAMVSDVLLAIKQDDIIKQKLHMYDRKGEWIDVVTRIVAGEHINHEGEIILFEHEEQEKMVLCEVLFHYQKQFHEEYIEEFKIRVIDDEFFSAPFFLR